MAPLAWGVLGARAEHSSECPQPRGSRPPAPSMLEWGPLLGTHALALRVCLARARDSICPQRQQRHILGGAPRRGGRPTRMLPLTPRSLGSPDTHTPGDGGEILFLYPRSFCCPQSPREPRPGNCEPAGQSWGGCVLCVLLAAPSPSSFPGGPRRRLRGWQLGPDWPGLNRCSASQARLAATGASQPAFVPLAVCSVPSLFSPGQAGQAEALKPWKQHRPPVQFQLFPPPGSFLRLCRPPGVLALPQPGSEQDSTHCPQPHPPWHLSWARAERAKGVLELWGSLTCPRHSSDTGSEDHGYRGLLP